MPKTSSDECKVEMKELQEPLEDFQQAQAERENQIEELGLYKIEIERNNTGLKKLKLAGELIELTANWVAVAEESLKKMSANLAALGKTVSLGAQELDEYLEKKEISKIQEKKMKLLENKLALAIRKELAAMKKVYDKLVAFWECSEKYKPRKAKIEINVSVHDTKGTPKLGSVLNYHIRCTGRVKLVGLDEEPSSFKERLDLVCSEPEGELRYKGSGKVDFAFDQYKEEYNAPKIKNFKTNPPEVIGGLDGSVFVTWKRFKPTILCLASIQFFDQSAPLEVKLNTEMLADGKPKSYLRSLYPRVIIDQCLSIALGSNHIFSPIWVKGPPHSWTYNFPDTKLTHPFLSGPISISMSIEITP